MFLQILIHCGESTVLVATLQAQNHISELTHKLKNKEQETLIIQTYTRQLKIHV